MSKRWEILEHTADVGIAACADTLGELYEALGEGLADFICPRNNVRSRERREIDVEAEDAAALAVDFLSEIMLAVEHERFAVASVRILEASETHLAAELIGEPLDPGRHELQTEVKAVTYHQLRVERQDDGCTGQVYLDI
jgi:SHS2 domain-containing protein